MSVEILQAVDRIRRAIKAYEQATENEQLAERRWNECQIARQAAQNLLTEVRHELFMLIEHQDVKV